MNLLKNPGAFAKSIWAFIFSVAGVLFTAVSSTPHKAFGDLGTIGWLGVVMTVGSVTGGVYGLTNKSADKTQSGHGDVMYAVAVLSLLVGVVLGLVASKM